MAKTLRNYHTHTHLCKHAKGTVSDYCSTAVSNGMDVLAITDHCPYPNGQWIAVRMDLSELPIYLKELEEAIAEFPDLKIVRGMECEYDPDFVNFQKDVFLGSCGFTCIAGAIHSFKHNGEWHNSFATAMDKAELHSYTDHTIAGMASGVFTYLAHPDLMGICHLGWDDDCIACSRAIIEAAINYNLPLEINANGFRKPKIQDGNELRYQYPWRPFWELVGEYGWKVLLNADAHRPEFLIDQIAACKEYSRELGLNVINDTFYEDYIKPLELGK